MTVSGGIAVSEENKDTEVDARGMISVDVSRLLSGRQDVQPLKIDPTNTGGNWGVASDAISQDLALVSLNLTVKKRAEERVLST